MNLSPLSHCSSNHRYPEHVILLLVFCTLTFGMCKGLVAAPQHTLESDQWQQLVIPGNSNNTSVRNLFSDSLSASQYNQLWVVYLWNNETAEYVNPGLEGTIPTGQGFWFIQTTGEAVSLDSTGLTDAQLEVSTACPSATGCTEIAHRSPASTSPFSMIGSALPSSIATGSLQFVAPDTSGDCADGCDHLVAAQAGLIDYSIMRYNPVTEKYDDISDSGELGPWDSAWFEASSSISGMAASYLFPSTDDNNNQVWSADSGFSVSSLGAEDQVWHAEVTRLINDDSNNWSGDPDVLFSAATLTNCQTGGSIESQGSYSYGRSGQSYVRALTNAIAETGDPAILERVFQLYQALWSNVADHDGRGYKFMYYARGNDTTHCGKDTHAMDEVLSHALLGHMARVFSHNKHIDSKYELATNQIVDYLLNTWFPKWMGRTYPNGPYASAPGANLVTSKWMNRGSHDSDMTLFVRGITHPDMAGMELFYNLGELTGDATFTDHSDAQCNWSKANLFETVTVNNSYRFKHLPFNDYDDTGASGLLNPYHETRDYAQQTMNFIASMVKENWCFDSIDIERFGNTYYSGNATFDVYTPGDTNLMAEDVDGGNDAYNDDTFEFTGIAGKAKFRMLSSAYLCGWDETGVIKNLATIAAQNQIVDQRYPSGNQTSPIMASGLLTCSE